jgi:hypothetical protein
MKKIRYLHQFFSQVSVVFSLYIHEIFLQSVEESFAVFDIWAEPDSD